MNDLPAAARWAVLAWAALVGSAVGSFLNVVVSRVPAGESVVRPRSRCPRCRTPIAWYDNLPVVSWIALRGRCRACHARISPRYPIVELLGAGAALVVASRHGLSASALAEFAFVAVLLALALIDLDTWLLPHMLTWPLLAFGVAASALGLSAATSLASSAAGAGVGFGGFALVSIVGEKVLKKEALGFGDVWLLAGLGAFLGLGALLPIVLLASVQGAVVGILLIAIGKAQRGPPPTPTTTPTEDDWVPPKNAVPFGPFLVAGALEWLWLGDLIARAVPSLELFRG